MRCSAPPFGRRDAAAGAGGAAATAAPRATTYVSTDDLASDGSEQPHQ